MPAISFQFLWWNFNTSTPLFTCLQSTDGKNRASKALNWNTKISIHHAKVVMREKCKGIQWASGFFNSQNFKDSIKFYIIFILYIIQGLNLFIFIFTSWHFLQMLQVTVLLCRIWNPPAFFSLLFYPLRMIGFLMFYYYIKLFKCHNNHLGYENNKKWHWPHAAGLVEGQWQSGKTEAFHR